MADSLHAPLPYIVRARIVIGDDEPPQTREFRIVAYDVLEAMLQVAVMIGGTGFDDPRVTIEEIKPDVEAYRLMRIEERRAATKQ